MTAHVRVEPWSEGDLDLLRRLNAPEMTAHLGGPESEQQVVDRHRRYLQPDAGMYRVLLDGVAVGSAGFWERSWRGGVVYEVGWGVLPEAQGRGVASLAAAAVVGEARAVGVHRWVHAFPSVENAASNSVCRKVGFTLLGEVDFEYPLGRPMRCNDWGLEM